MSLKLVFVAFLLIFVTSEAAGIFEKLIKLFGGDKMTETEIPASGISPDWLTGGLMPEMSDTDLQELITRSAELIKQGKAESSISELLTALEADPRISTRTSCLAPSFWS